MDPSRKKKQRTCIDDLPEEVLSTIMSNLEVRDVVRASLTCKQWLHLPALLSEITLDGFSMAGDDGPLVSPYGDDNLFVERVNKFLKQLQKLRLATGRKTPLLSFKVHFHLDTDSSVIDNWVYFALSSGVRVLDIYRFMAGCSMYVFPCHLLNKIPGIIVLEKLSLESSTVFARNRNTQLPSLKELALENSHLNEYDIGNILARCPNLLKLSFNFCTMPATFIVDSKSLACLTVQWCRGLKQIQLPDGGALTQFMYFGQPISLVQFHSAPKLTDVTFCVDDDDDPTKADEYVSQELHRHFPVMKSLLLLKLTEIPAPVSLDFRPDAFRRLETLKLYCHPKTRFSLLLVLKMLRACPLIRRLVMVPPVSLDRSAKDDDVQLPIQTFHNFLNSVQINGFNGNEGHVKLVTLLIQASAVVDQVILTREVQTEFVRYEGWSGRKWRGDQESEAVRKSLISLMKSGTLIFNCANSCVH